MKYINHIIKSFLVFLFAKRLYTMSIAIKNHLRSALNFKHPQTGCLAVRGNEEDLIAGQPLLKENKKAKVEIEILTSSSRLTVYITCNRKFTGIRVHRDEKFSFEDFKKILFVLPFKYWAVFTRNFWLLVIASYKHLHKEEKKILKEQENKQKLKDLSTKILELIHQEPWEDKIIVNTQKITVGIHNQMLVIGTSNNIVECSMIRIKDSEPDLSEIEKHVQSFMAKFSLNFQNITL